MVTSIALRPGTDWTSWITFAVAGIMQATLLTMCIVWTFRQQRLGIDEFGNPLDGSGTHPNVYRPLTGDDDLQVDVPGLVTTEEEDPAMMRIALTAALTTAAEEEIRTGEVAVDDIRVDEATPLLGSTKTGGGSTESRGLWARLFG